VRLIFPNDLFSTVVKRISKNILAKIHGLSRLVLAAENRLKKNLAGINKAFIFATGNTTKLVVFFWSKIRPKESGFVLKFSKKTEYALIAVLEMTGRSPDNLLTTRDLSRSYKIPLEILGKVLQKLVKNHILISVQGVHGGYLLSRSAEKIKVKEIIEAVEGPIQLISCSSGRICDCEQIFHCNIRQPMGVIQYELAQFFDGITVMDLRERFRTLPVANTTSQPILINGGDANAV
jgi:Rrf2 family protein